MGNFKAGDVVVCMDNTRYTSQVKPGVPKMVHSVSPCGKYLRVFRDDTRQIGGYYAEDFILFQEEQDDPLPPAPESVLYNDEYPDRRVYKQTWLRAYPDCEGTLLVLQSGQYGEPAVGVGVRISPDAALQLTHDLRRMAMEIKRKEKQNA